MAEKGKDEKGKSGAKSVFDTIANAVYNPTGSGQYFRRGDYEVTLKVAKMRDSQNPKTKGQVFFVIECIIDKVVLAYEDSNKPGERVAQVRNLSDDSYGFGAGDAKAFVAAVLDVPIDDLTAEDVAGALEGDGTGLAGTQLQVHVYRKTTGKGKEIDIPQFASMNAEMPEGDGTDKTADDKDKAE